MIERGLPNGSACRIGNKKMMPVVVERETVSHQCEGPQSVGGITRRGCHGYRPGWQPTDIAPYTANAIDEVDLARHRLNTKHLFAVDRGRRTTIGSRSGYFPHSAPTGTPVARPKISKPIEG